MASDEPPSPQHLEWVINGRAATQHTTLKLYALFDKYEKELADYSSEASTLASASFSLWRAVFLADRKVDIDIKNKHAQAFLVRVLADNAIGYAQDRSARSWTFVYYMQTARFFWIAPALDATKRRCPNHLRASARREIGGSSTKTLFYQEVDWLTATLEKARKQKRAKSKRK